MKHSTSSTQQQLKKLSKNTSRGPAVKQFQWFEMQTRVRKIIQQIIDPIQKQMVKNNIEINQLQNDNKQVDNKIHYLLKMTTNDPEIFQTGVFKNIQDKFNQQQKLLTYLKEQVKNNTNFINNKIALIDERMKQSNDIIVQIEHLKILNRQNLKNQTQKFDQVKKNIQINIDKISSNQQINSKKMIQQIESLQKQISVNVLKIQHFSRQFLLMKDFFLKQKSINDNLIAQSIKGNQYSINLQSKINEINKKIKQMNKTKSYLNDIHSDFKKLHYEFHNVLPLISEAQINQCLYKVLPQKFHPRIAVYEFQKYNELNQKILNQHSEQIQKLDVQKFDGQKIIKQSQQRNTKLLTKLKRSYYKNNDVQLDYISFEERQRLMNNFDYKKLCQVVDELEELENQNANKKNSKLTQEDIITIIKMQFQMEKTSLIQKIQSQLKDSKIYLQHSQQLTNKILDSLGNKIQKNQKNINEFKLHQNNQFNKINQNYKILFSSMDIFQNNSKIFKSTIKDLQRFLLIEYKQKRNIQRFEQKDHQYKIKSRQIKDQRFSGVLKRQQLSDNHQNLLENIQKQLQKIIIFSLPELKMIDDQISEISQNLDLKSNEKSYRRYSSYQLFKNNKKESFELKKLNISTQIKQNFDKKAKQGLFDIVQFKNDKIMKSSSSNFSKRTRPILSRNKFLEKSSEKNQLFENMGVKQSLIHFNSLKKQNIDYLK